jgi:WD40 repeat protein
LAASYSSGQIAFWDVNSKQMVHSISLPYRDPMLELTPDGHYLLTNSRDGIIRIWGIAP